MVKYSQQQVDDIFYSLADHTRRDILKLIIEKNPTVSEIAKPFDISLPAISKHIKVLETNGLISRHKEGRIIRFKVIPEPIQEALKRMQYFEKFWNIQLDNLEKFLTRKGGG